MILGWFYNVFENLNYNSLVIVGVIGATCGRSCVAELLALRIFGKHLID